MSVIPFRQHDPNPVTIDEYVEYLYGEGLSPKTIRTYSRLIERAMVFLAEDRNTTVEAAGPYDIVELAQIVPQNRSTLTQLRSALAHFWNMTGRVRPPVKAIRVPRRGEMVSRALSEEDAAKLVTAATDRHPEGTATMLGLYLALRVGEIVRVRWDRFDQAMEWYTVENIKGGAVDRLPVHPALRSHLQTVRAAKKVLKLDVGTYVFPGRGSRDHVTEASAWGWVKELSVEAGIGDVHTHRLRHTALTVANDATGDLRAVSKFARHSRIETTMGYTRSTPAALEKVMGSLDYTNTPEPAEEIQQKSGPRWGPARSG